jgi:hypothetical protein
VAYSGMGTATVRQCTVRVREKEERERERETATDSGPHI